MKSEPLPEGPSPRRIVSLVPSLSESLFSLGLGERVVGVTDWCVHPAAAVEPLPKVGGTKDPDIDAIARLTPDLVIANHEENTERTVRHLRERGLTVWVTYPQTVREGAEVLEALAGLGASPAVREEICSGVWTAVREAEANPPAHPTRVFCPIWRDPWMAVGSDTYADGLLRLCGGTNVFASTDGNDRRYPKVSLDDVAAAQPEVILLPDEPYAFAAADAAELAGLSVPAASQGRIHLIDGTLVSWYGPRIEAAIRQIRALLSHPPD